MNTLVFWDRLLIFSVFPYLSLVSLNPFQRFHWTSAAVNISYLFDDKYLIILQARVKNSTIWKGCNIKEKRNMLPELFLTTFSSFQPKASNIQFLNWGNVEVPRINYTKRVICSYKPGSCSYLKHSPLCGN